MMEQKAFTKIDKFKDGSIKWKSLRTQVENLAEITFPGEGRRILQWARSLGSSELIWDDLGDAFNFQPPAPVKHIKSYHVGQDLAITLSYLLEGEAEAILALEMARV